MIDEGRSELDAAPSLAEADLLAACPLCGYALRGLPVEHRCPECGFAVDRRWRVFGGVTRRGWRRKRWHAGVLTLLLPFVYILTWLVLTAVLPLSGTERWWVRAALLGVLGLLAYVALYRPKRFVAVGPQGVVVVFDRNRFDRYEWSRMGPARYDLLRKSLVFGYGEKQIRLKVFRYFGSNISAVDECVQAINAYRRAEGPGAVD